MLDRRALLLSGLALGACATLPEARPRVSGGAAALLRQALRQHGGVEALAGVRALDWTGTATVTAGGRTVSVQAMTRVVPFTSARSDTWLLTETTSEKRTLIVEPDGAWAERDGVRRELPARQALHERLQYAIYGLMLLAPLLAPGVVVERRPDRGGLRWLAVRHPSAAPTELGFDAAGLLVAAENSVPAPDSGAMVAQRLDFSEHRMAGGVLWPRRMTIAQDGRPWLELRLATFAVER